MKRWIWIWTAALAVVLSACSQPTATFETANAQPPVISRFGASPTSGQAPLLVRFFWSIADANRDLMSCELDVSYDGNFTADYSVGLPRTRTSNCTSSSRINHTFGPGQHTVVLRVCDATSCTTRSQTITVTANPNNRPPVIANFAASPNPVQTGSPTTFSWTVSDPEGNPLTCTFDPDTATTGNEQAVPCNLTHNHTYTSKGSFTAQLSVSDGSSTTTRQTTVEVITTFSQIASGVIHSCAITPTGNAYCWGVNTDGRLGNGTNTNANTPQPVTMPTGVSISQIAGGYLHTCAVSTTGQAYCWGDNNYGQLGNGTNMGANTPQAVSMPTGVTFSQISAGEAHTCALSTAGNAYCWGWNVYGQLGNASTGGSTNTPQAVSMPSGVTFSQISVGSFHSCALGSNNQGYCWGNNDYGQLGNGNTTDANTPQVVSGSLSFGQIRSGFGQSCALTTTGNAYCWGNNFDGQLGKGDSGNGTDASTPQAVSGSLTFSQVGLGYIHTCAITTTGSTYCWGFDGNGQLGKGDNIPANTPQAVLAGQVPPGVTLSQVTAGLFHTCALATNGNAYCWGWNAAGQLGTGNNTDFNTPQAVVMP